ncbi:hypothetical protein ABE10_00110, partial [Bacillus toyonensis]|nr:hypothetical protein [Bacillus toyonensis]
GVVADRTQEVDLTQIRTQRLDEVELAVRALPQQEVAQALLAARADHEVGVGLSSRVEMLADHLRRQVRGQILERPSGGLMVRHDASHRVDDLVASAVADSEVDVESRVPVGALLGLGENAGKRLGQDLCPAYVLDPPVPFVGQRIGELADDLDQVRDLSRVALDDVVRRQQVQRDDSDPQVVTPAQELTHLRRTGTMAVRSRRIAELSGPASVAVDHHRDVMRHGRRVHPAPQAADV